MRIIVLKQYPTLLNSMLLWICRRQVRRGDGAGGDRARGQPAGVLRQPGGAGGGLGRRAGVHPQPHPPGRQAALPVAWGPNSVHSWMLRGAPHCCFLAVDPYSCSVVGPKVSIKCGCGLVIADQDEQVERQGASCNSHSGPRGTLSRTCLCHRRMRWRSWGRST